MKDYYAILGLDPDASPESIKLAYRHLARTAHPDLMGHLGSKSKAAASDRMAELNEAYAVLSNPRQRREYDEEWRAFQAGLPEEAPAPSAEAATEPAVPAPPRARARSASEVIGSVVGQFSAHLRQDLLSSRHAAVWTVRRLEGFEWAAEATSWFRYYCVALRGFNTADLEAAQKFTNYAHLAVERSRSVIRQNYFLFLMPFQRIAAPDQVAASCRRFAGNARDHALVILMDVSHGRSITCGPRVQDEKFEAVLKQIGVSRP